MTNGHKLSPLLFPPIATPKDSWHKLYHRCCTRVLFVYHVWWESNSDDAVEALQKALPTFGIHVDGLHNPISTVHHRADVDTWLQEVEKMIKDYRVVIDCTNGSMLSVNRIL
jgi:hypothetical protein